MMCSNNLILDAANILKNAGCVAFPTETVYGLGANALDDHAVAKIYAIKNRPNFNPLIVHVKNIDAAKELTQWNDAAEALATKFWPGAMTLVLKRKANCPLSLLVSAGLDTVAIRVPAHPVAQALLHVSGLPIAAPSANISGRISPTSAAHVQEELGDKVSLILDGGDCEVGLESTVIDVSKEQPVILRQGGVTQEAIEEVTGKIATTASTEITSPGMLESHYAPNATLRLNATHIEQGEVLLAFGDTSSCGILDPAQPLRVSQDDVFILNLTESGNLTEAAANLFRMLRELDKSGAGRIAVMPIPQKGLGLAINDRLTRAAAPK